MIRTATACVILVLASATGGAAQQRTPTSVAVPAAESSDRSLDNAAARLTDAIRATAALSGAFELYDTNLTKQAAPVGDARSVSRLPTRFVCLARVSPAIPGWVQATISFVDGPLKDPVVRISSPVLLRSDSSFTAFARLAWERLAKAERKRLDSIRPR